MRKRMIIALAAVIAVAVLVAGCQPPATESQGTTSPAAEESVSTEPEETMSAEMEESMKPEESMAAATYMDVSVEDAKKLIDETPELTIIDVSPEYDNGHLPGAVHYYLGDGSLEEAIGTLDKSKPYLVYCHADAPAIQGATMLVDAGFETVYRLEGNYGAWVDAGYPVESGAGYIDISAMLAKELIDETPDIMIIDVSPDYDAGHLPGAEHYYLGDGSLEEAIPMLDMDKTYLVYCHADAPSIEGATMLVDAGFEPVYRLEGNYSAWVDAGYPVEQ